MDIDLLNCKTEIEKQILHLETRTLIKITEVEKDIKNIQRDIAELVTKPEFHPVRMITYGLAGGVFIAFLGAVISKVVGW